MSSLDDYRARVTGTIKSNVSDDSKKLYQISFKNSPSYYPVTVNTPSSPYTSTPLDAQIVDDPTKTKEVKQITIIPNQVLNYGDLISWLGDYWLNTTVDYMGGMYYRGSIQKCYSSLKWLDFDGIPREAYFAIATDVQRGSGINFGSVIPLPKERRYLFVQNNAYTVQFKKDQRFIFDLRAWKVLSIDRLKTSLVSLELEEHAIDDSIDNTSLRIADYVGNVANYTIHILNGGNLSIQANKTLQINTEVKNNGNIVTVPMTFTSDTSNVATVDANGLITTIANGNATIKAAITSQPTVFDLLPITVQFSTVPNYTVEIVGDAYLSKTTSKTYNILIKNNGVIDNTRTVTWNLYGDDGVSSTSLAKITSQSSTQITLQGTSIGFIKLKATIVGSGSVVDIMRIQVTKLI